MTTTDNEQSSRGEEGLHRVARAHMARVSTAAGLPEPAVLLVPTLGSGSPAANAKFTTLRGVPTIKITEAAVRDLPSSALEFLLAHEFWHSANNSWWRRRVWLYVLGIGLGVILLLGGIIMGATAESFNTSPAAGYITSGFGAIITVRGFFGYFADSRAEEIRADLFAARHHGHPEGAESLFAAWDDDKPEAELSSAGRRWRLRVRTHPYRATRLDAIRTDLTHRHLEPGVR